MIKISLIGRGGELDSRTVKTEEEISDAVKDIASDCVLSPGDSIVIVDDEEAE